MFEGFLEMQSMITQVQGRLEIDGDMEYRKIEYGTERFLHTPEPGSRLRDEEETKRFTLRKWWVQ